MEDCFIFNELMEKYGDENQAEVLAAFTEFRSVDAHAICDLAMYNYIEVSPFHHVIKLMGYWYTSQKERRIALN